LESIFDEEYGGSDVELYRVEYKEIKFDFEPYSKDYRHIDLDFKDFVNELYKKNE